MMIISISVFLSVSVRMTTRLINKAALTRNHQLNSRLKFHSSVISMAVNNRRGAFIVLEGCDRCGKTTQSQLLVSNLIQKGHKAELLRFPDRTSKVGSLISDYLKNAVQLEDHVIHLLFSANRWEMKEKMLDLIKDNTTLIADRYSFSGVAYSASKLGMELDWCKQPEIGLPAPDVVLFLDVSTEVAVQRGGFGEERYEDKETHERVRRTYDQLMDSNWVIIDADKSVEKLQAQLLDVVEGAISKVGNSDVKLLWK